MQAGGARFKGIRRSTSYDADPGVLGPLNRNPAGVMMEPKFREGFAELGKRGLSFDAWMMEPQLPELIDLARQFPEHADRAGPCRHAAGAGELCGQAAGAVRRVAREYPRAGEVRECACEAGRARHAVLQFPVDAVGDARAVRAAGEGMGAVCRDVHRGVRREARDVREQLPGRRGELRLSDAVECAEADREGRERGREARAVLRDGEQVLSVGAVTGFRPLASEVRRSGMVASPGLARGCPILRRDSPFQAGESCSPREPGPSSPAAAQDRREMGHAFRTR